MLLLLRLLLRSLQCILFDQSFDKCTYRCIRTREGHVCTQALLRAWPNDEQGNLQLRTHHFRPPGGLDEEATENFKDDIKAAFELGEIAMQSKVAHGHGNPRLCRAV